MILNFFSFSYHQQIQMGCRRGNPLRFGQAFNLTMLTFNKQTVTVESSFSLCSDDSIFFLSDASNGRLTLFLVRLSPAALIPFHLNISMPILHTVFYTIPTVLTRRICLSI